MFKNLTCTDHVCTLLQDVERFVPSLHDSFVANIVEGRDCLHFVLDSIRHR